MGPDLEPSVAVVTFREAHRDDLPAIIGLIAAEQLGAYRDTPELPLDPGYTKAFEAIDRDSNQLLLVAVEAGGVIGTLQLTLIPGLARRGAWRGQIEAMRIATSRRGHGLGQRLVEHAIQLCRTRGCKHIQLTSDSNRAAAHRFYARLGFQASQVGFKLVL